MILLESLVPTWVAGVAMLVVLLGALLVVRGVGGGRPHS